MQTSTKTAVAIGIVALSSAALTKDSVDNSQLVTTATMASLPYRLPLQADAQVTANAQAFVRSMDEALRNLREHFESIACSDPDARAAIHPTVSDREFKRSLEAYQTSYGALVRSGDFERSLLHCEALRTDFRLVLETAVKEYRIRQDVAARFASAEAIHWNTFICHSLDFSGTAPQPEYRDHLEQLRINCPPHEINSTPSPTWQTQTSIICNVPDYTQVNVFVPQLALEDCRTVFAAQVGPSRYSQIRFEGVHHPLFSQWAQDASEGDTLLQRTSLTVYSPTRYPVLLNGTPLEYQGRSYVSTATHLQQGAVELPVIFQGGNIFFAETSTGTPVLLVGSGEYVSTQQQYGTAGLEINEQQFCAELAHGFDTPNVRIIGPFTADGFQKQPAEMFHLDQALLPLQPGVIGILTPDFDFQNLDEAVERERFESRLAEFEQRWNEQLGITLERSGEFPNWVSYRNYPPRIVPANPPPGYVPSIFRAELREINEIGTQVIWERDKHRLNTTLETMRTQLQDFSFVPLTCSAASALNFRFPTNAIVFTNRTTGEPTILMPIYPKLRRGEEASSTEAVLSSLDSYDLQNIETLRNLGFTVIPVVDQTDGRNKGSLHCLTSRY